MTATHAVMHTEAVPEAASVTDEELARDTAHILARVAAGEPIEITHDGRRFAILLPIDPVEAKTQELIEAGILPADWREQQQSLFLQLRERHTAAQAPATRQSEQKLASEVLIEMRNEERF